MVVLGLVVAVCAGILAGIASFRARRLSTAAELAEHLPSEPGLIVGVDVAALRQSGLLAGLNSSRVYQEPEYAAFVLETGFDYQRDLDYILAWFRPGTTCMLLRGRFDWPRLKSYVEAQRGACRNAYCRMPGSTAERQISFFPLTKEVMALGVGSNEWIATMVGERNPSRRGFKPPERLIWIQTPGALMRDAAALPVGTRLFAKAMEDAEMVQLSLAAGATGMSVELDVTCRSPEAASTLAFQLQGLTNLLKQMLAAENKEPNPEDLSGVLAGGVFNQVDRRVLGRWPVGLRFFKGILE